MSQWCDILNADQLAARYASTAELDPRFAAESRKFWEAQGVNRLCALRDGAWFANDPEGYQMARSYLALSGFDAYSRTQKMMVLK